MHHFKFRYDDDKNGFSTRDKIVASFKFVEQPECLLTYRNDIRGFQLLYPESWFPHERAGGILMFTKKQDPPRGEETERTVFDDDQLVIDYEELKDAQGNSIAWHDWYVDYLKSPEGQSLEVTWYETKDHRQIMQIIKDSPREVLYYIPVGGNKIYQLEVSPNKPENIETAERILESFTILH